MEQVSITKTIVHSLHKPTSTIVVYQGKYLSRVVYGEEKVFFLKKRVYDSDNGSMATHLSIYQSINPSIYPFFYPFVYASAYASTYPSTHPSIYPSIHACIYPCILPSIRPSIRPSIHENVQTKKTKKKEDKKSCVWVRVSGGGHTVDERVRV